MPCGFAECPPSYRRAISVYGLDDGFTVDELKKKYREKALCLHPDKNPHPEAKPMFLRYQQAYENVINDPLIVEFAEGRSKQRHHLSSAWVSEAVQQISPPQHAKEEQDRLREALKRKREERESSQRREEMMAQQRWERDQAPVPSWCLPRRHPVPTAEYRGIYAAPRIFVPKPF